MTNFSNIRKWYSGKALDVIDNYVIPTLTQAEADGYWPKGASRKIKAALNKGNIARKQGAAADKKVRTVDYDYGTPQYNAQRTIERALIGVSYCVVERANDSYGLDQIDETILDPAMKDAMAVAQAWASDFAPIAELMNKLDASRPKPVFVFGTLSPTVKKTLMDAGLTLKPETIRMPEIKWKWKTYIDKDGKEYRQKVGYLIWPDNTRHHCSRFANGFTNCEACGHRIKNSFNWVPLLFDDESGIPHSLWVGRDCAKNLFNCDVTGDAEYKDAA